MAEIEFERRGTPLWVVVLALLVIIGIVWAVVARRHSASPAATSPAAVAADSSAAAKSGPPAPNTAPPAAAGPSAQLSTWVDSSKTPVADQQPAYIGTGLQLLAGALQERAPLAGVQINLIRAMSDTLRMPNLKPSQYLNATQAAFFATTYALQKTNAGEALNAAASALQLTKPLAQQADVVHHFFATAAKVLKAPIVQSPPPGKQTPAAKPPTPQGKV